MNLKEKLEKRVFSLVGATADSLGRECYVVGGYVRDLIIGRSSKDIDFVTVGSGIELAEAVAASIGPKNIIIQKCFTNKNLSLLCVAQEIS